MGLREIGWGGSEWIELAQDRNKWRDLGNTEMNIWVPSNVDKILSTWETGGISRRAQLNEVSNPNDLIFRADQCFNQFGLAMLQSVWEQNATGSLFNMKRGIKIILKGAVSYEPLQFNIWRSYSANRPWRPIGGDTSRLSNFLDNHLTDGGDVFSFTRRPFFTPQEHSWYSFLLGVESTSGP
jgi:hypothetical protein